MFNLFAYLRFIKLFCKIYLRFNLIIYINNKTQEKNILNKR